ncbi:MAG: sugar transferase [Pirellulales bacterium]
MSTSRFQRTTKRAVDIAASATGLILLSPLLTCLWLLVRWRMGAPVFFRQERPGLGGRPFVLYKFRTMSDARDAAGALRPDRERLTRVGRFLRKTSLDELPELFNVLRGEMSLVGPRPLLMEYLDRYTPEQNRRHEVRPGITGWAQVGGRQDLKLSERIERDLWYIDHQSLWLDVRILLLTLGTVFGGAGIQPGRGPRSLDDLAPPQHRFHLAVGRRENTVDVKPLEPAERQNAS